MQLETIYDSPGVLLLATDDDGERLGCVGIQSRGDGVGEIRRLFVRDTARGLGLGRSLMATLTDHAADAGFSQLVLNTMPAMTAAVGLYESLDYKPIPAYVDEPLDGTLYLGTTIGARV